MRLTSNVSLSLLTILVFDNFIEDLDATVQKSPENEKYVNQVSSNIGKINSTFKELKVKLLTFDTKLVDVL